MIGYRVEVFNNDTGLWEIVEHVLPKISYKKKYALYLFPREERIIESKDIELRVTAKNIAAKQLYTNSRRPVRIVEIYWFDNRWCSSDVLWENGHWLDAAKTYNYRDMV